MNSINDPTVYPTCLKSFAHKSTPDSATSGASEDLSDRSRNEAQPLRAERAAREQLRVRPVYTAAFSFSNNFQELNSDGHVPASGLRCSSETVHMLSRLPAVIFSRFLFSSFWVTSFRSPSKGSNQQPDQQNAMSCATSVFLASSRGLASGCKVYSGQIHTVEVIGSNPIAPTIVF